MNRPSILKPSQEIKDLTPATLTIATIFLLLVVYFIVETYFTASEYYVGGPPYLLLILCGLVAAIIFFILLNRIEPQRKNSALYAVLAGFGAGLAAYSLIARLNIMTDADGLKSYAYTLGTDYIWRSENHSLPELRLYLHSSKWWQQYKPGDSYTFELRKGGLKLWQVNMSKIYESQKLFYDCKGVWSCMSK